MREKIEQRINELAARERQLWADLNATIGAREELALLLEQIDTQGQEEGAE